MVSSSLPAADPVTVPVYYTVGYWNESQAVPIKLVRGMNSLTFTRSSDRPLVIKSFHLYVKDPAIPPPPANYTPVPRPPPDTYIQVPVATSCEKQGLREVTDEYCSDACLALQLDFTGDHARPNISGCFTLTEGQYAGNCNFNTNASAHCQPPCYLYGSPVAQLCHR